MVLEWKNAGKAHLFGHNNLLLSSVLSRETPTDQQISRIPVRLFQQHRIKSFNNSLRNGPHNNDRNDYPLTIHEEDGKAPLRCNERHRIEHVDKRLAHDENGPHNGQEGIPRFSSIRLKQSAQENDNEYVNRAYEVDALDGAVIITKKRIDTRVDVEHRE